MNNIRLNILQKIKERTGEDNDEIIMDALTHESIDVKIKNLVAENKIFLLNDNNERLYQNLVARMFAEECALGSPTRSRKKGQGSIYDNMAIYPYFSPSKIVRN